MPSARFMGGREFDLLTGKVVETPDAATVAKVMEQGIMAIPTFAPGSGPFPHAVGRWTHNPASLAAQEVTAAASLYEALMTAACFDLLGSQGHTVIEGPFARNDLFCDALQAVLKRMSKPPRAAPAQAQTLYN